MALTMLAVSAVAEPVVRVDVEDFISCVPVVTATFDEVGGSVTFEWSSSENGTYVTLGTVTNPSGTTCAFTNNFALVADKRWYRVSVGGETSAAVGFTRFRRLERNLKDERVMAVGCMSISSSIKAFDGNVSTSPDNSSGGPVGIDFGTAVYVACARWYAKNSRMGGYCFYGAATRADYDAGIKTTRSDALPKSTGWFSTMLYDADTAIQCCWIVPERADCPELQFYGWTTLDVANANGTTTFDYVPVTESTNFWPIVTATHQAGVTSFKLQRAASASGPFTDLVSVASPTGTAYVYTNTAAKVGQTVYYRVVTTGGGIGDYASTPVPFVRFRQLERDPADLTKVRAGYATLSTNKKDFDGDLATYSTANPHGIDFNEQVHIAALRFYPREGQTSRLNNRYAYADTTFEERQAGHHVQITPYICEGGLEWRWLDSLDTEGVYRYCFIETYSPGKDLAEMQVFGWTDADIEAAGDPFYPTALDAVNGESVGVVRLAWGGGKNLVSYEIQSRVEGTDEWTTCVTGLEPSVEAYELSDLDDGSTYEFRVKGEGRGGETGYSPTATVFVYQLVPGAGTGLMAALMGPCGTRQFATPWTYEYRVFTNICLDVTTNTLFEKSSAQDALVVLRGQLIVPLDGMYTLSLVGGSSDGTALYLDGAVVWNCFTGASLQSATRALTAGNHPIEIHYRSPGKARLLKFYWALAGVWGERVVPQSQLVPAPLADCRVYEPSKCEEWNFSIATAEASTIPRLEWKDLNSFRMLADIDGHSNARTALLTRNVKGTFTLEAEIDSSKLAGAYGSLVVGDPADPSGTLLNFIVASGQLGMKRDADWGPISWTKITDGRTLVRIRRLEDKTLVFDAKNKIWDGGSTWHTCLTMPQGSYTDTKQGSTVSITCNSVIAGYSQSGGSKGALLNSDITVNKFNLRKKQGLIVFLQ